MALSRGFSSEQIGQQIDVGCRERSVEVRTGPFAGVGLDFADLAGVRDTDVGLPAFDSGDTGLVFRVFLRFRALGTWFLLSERSERGNCDLTADWTAGVEARGCCFPGLARGDWLLLLVSDSSALSVVCGGVALLPAVVA